MSSLVNRHLENGQNGMSFLSNSNATNNNKAPMDMMNTLDFFGPGQPNALMMNSNWSLANGNNGHHHADHSALMNGTTTGGNFQDAIGLHDHAGNNNNVSSNPVDKSGGATTTSDPSATPTTTARSVEDLELQVINAKMETQMLENQLNAVIKRNRRKLYA